MAAGDVMNRSLFRSGIALLLTAVLLFALFVPAFAVLGEGYYTTLPTVYLQGQGEHIYLPSGEKIYDGGDLPEGFLTDAVKECMPFFIA